MQTVVYALDIKINGVLNYLLRFVFYGFEQLLQDKGILFLKRQSGLRPLLCYVTIQQASVFWDHFPGHKRQQTVPKIVLQIYMF